MELFGIHDVGLQVPIPYLAKYKRLATPTKFQLLILGVAESISCLFTTPVLTRNSTIMSVPAWKQAILERKRQQEEAEKKKHLEKEQYYASLPPWKRAMLKKKEEGAATTTETKEERVSPLLKQKNEQIPAWKQARTRKDSGSSDDNQAQRDKTSTATENVSKEPFTDSIIEKKSITNSLRGKFEQQSSPQRFRKIEVKRVTAPTEVDKRKEELPKPSEKEEEKRSDEKLKPLQKLKGQFEQREDIDKFRRPSVVKMQTQSFDVDDEKIKTMPKWKQDLLLRRQQQKTTKSSSPISKTPPQSASPTTDHKVKSDHSDMKESNQSPVNNSRPPISLPQSSSSPVSKNAPVSFNHISTQESKPLKDNQPEIVNASDKKGDTSPKLLHKEGKELKPPVYQMKSKWADMMEDDPEFKNLPAWKQNLIKRRKNDFKNRTAPPIIEKKEEKPKEEVNEPLPGPLWTPTRTVTTREIPKEQEKTEDTNPLLDMRKNLRKVSKQNSQTNEILDETSRRVLLLAGYRSKTGEQPLGGQLVNQKTEEIEEMEIVSPLKENSKKPKKVCCYLLFLIIMIHNIFLLEIKACFME